MQHANRWGHRNTVTTCLLTISFFLHGVSVYAQDRYSLEEGGWNKQTRYEASTPEGQLQTIRRALAQDDVQRALELADQWIEGYPNHAMLPEAYLLRGDTLVAHKEYFKSLYDYEHVIRHYAATEAFHTAMEREFRIAKLFASGVKRRFIGMRILSAAGEAEEIFIRIQERSPGSHLGERASLALGDFYFDRAQMANAAEAYDLFLDNYPNSQYIERVMLRLIRASLATFKGPEFDPTGLIESAQRIKTFQQRFPAAAERIGTEALLVRIDESLALKMYYTAQWFESQGERVSAIYTYQRVVRDYAGTAAAQRAIEHLAELGASATLSELPPQWGGASRKMTWLTDNVRLTTQIPPVRTGEYFQFKRNAWWGISGGAFCVMMIVLGGCGYTYSELFPKHIRTVAVANI